MSAMLSIFPHVQRADEWTWGPPSSVSPIGHQLHRHGRPHQPPDQPAREPIEHDCHEEPAFVRPNVSRISAGAYSSIRAQTRPVPSNADYVTLGEAPRRAERIGLSLSAPSAPRRQCAPTRHGRVSGSCASTPISPTGQLGTTLASLNADRRRLNVACMRASLASPQRASPQ
jgi:hypothetical protein